MSNASFSFALPQNPTVSNTILWSGLISGLLDATAGVVVYFLFKGMDPIQVLQYIASGVFGTAAFSGGLLMAVAGLILHFVIAFAFAAGFFFVYPNIPVLAKNIWITGLLYGLFIWLFMNLLVLPNSNTPQSPRDFVSVLEVIWHMSLVGLPMALITARYYKTK